MARQTAKAIDVIIIGGGLVGLCGAFHLLQTHTTVGVIMGTHRGRASEAAAGMLAPTCEWNTETSHTFLEFLRHGRAYYKEFLPLLLSDSSSMEEVGYSERKFLLLDLLENERTLADRFERLQAAGANVRWLTTQEVHCAEPQVNPDAIRGAIQVADDGLVNPRALHAQLRDRIIADGARLWETNLAAVRDLGDTFAFTLESGERLFCSRVVIAAGAWSWEVAEKFGAHAPVSPVKGQMIQLVGPSGLLRHVLYMPAGACGCLLERSPGVYIAGTSEEYVSAEVSNTSRVIAEILTRINRVFLPAADFVLQDMWSGFRPITPDELPIIGFSADPRILVATGHFRNGILLSPLTGLLIASLLNGETPSLDLHPYRYERTFLPQYRYASAY